MKRHINSITLLKIRCFRNNRRNLRHIALFVHFTCIIIFCVGMGIYNAQADNNAGAAFSIWPDTGQTKCYDDNGEITCPSEGQAFYGQDAQYQGPQRSYTKLGQGGVELPNSATPADGWIMTRDNVTGLIWEIKTDDGGIHDKDNKYTWCDSNIFTNGGYAGSCGNGTDTEDFIATLNTAKFGGYSDWRLPTVKELSTLLNSGAPNSHPDPQYFPKTGTGDYWSSTTYIDKITYAWRVAFDGWGTISTHYKSSTYYVRAVRDSQFQSPAILYIDNSDGTITDNTTGLMWQKCNIGQTYSITNGCEGGGQSYEWKDALNKCENLELAGYRDWRLPNRNELQSIVDYTTSDPSIVNFFSPTYDRYWTSTTWLADETYAFYIPFHSAAFHSGAVIPWGKSYSYAIRCVRGSQPQSKPDSSTNILKLMVPILGAIGSK